MPDYHMYFNANRRYTCPPDMPKLGSCAEDNNLCVKSVEIEDEDTGEKSVVLSKNVEATEEQLQTRAAKEFITCARLCVENALGVNMHFHPNDYQWNNTQLLPESSEGCVGKLVLIIVDQLKTVVVQQTTISAQQDL